MRSEPPKFTKPSTPLLGVIEGFFGLPWSHQVRCDYARFLKDAGYDFYLYAPKKDPYLRRRWQEHWPESEHKQFQELRATYRNCGVQFGLGLSPFELYQEDAVTARQRLEKKLEALKPFEPDILGLLFDDMRGDMPDLAARQTELVHVAQAALPEARLLFCPTYYSFDPILDKVFGERPARYLKDLGANLNTDVDVFWTGPEVCSTAYPEDHLKSVTQLLQRKPFLWDNYPVNDGKKSSRFLHLRSFDHNASVLNPHLSGHAVNPMNQAALSRIPLWTLPQNYAQADYVPQQAFQKSLYKHCDTEVAEALLEDIVYLQDKGLDHLEGKQAHFEKKYAQLAKDYQSPYAREVLDFLKGVYAFDPACLTD